MKTQRRLVHGSKLAELKLPNIIQPRSNPTPGYIDPTVITNSRKILLRGGTDNEGHNRVICLLLVPGKNILADILVLSNLLSYYRASSQSYVLVQRESCVCSADVERSMSCIEYPRAIPISLPHRHTLLFPLSLSALYPSLSLCVSLENCLNISPLVTASPSLLLFSLSKDVIEGRKHI